MGSTTRSPRCFGKALWPLLSKTNLSPLRFANVLVLALLVVRLIPAQAAFLAGRVALPVYQVRAAFPACLLPRDPARDDWASGNQRISRRSPPAVRRLGGRDRDHDRHRRADGLVQCRANSVGPSGPAGLGDRRRGVSMAGTFLHRTIGLMAAAGIGLLALLGVSPRSGAGLRCSRELL